MEQYSQTSQEKDPQLWAIAKRRAEFKRSIAYYIVINAFLWLVWLLSGTKTNDNDIPWPVWSTAGWGIGMIFYYLSTYHYPKEKVVEKEYEKLKQQQK